MLNRIRVLGIAPYEGMKNLMESIVKDYPQIELSMFVGDMEQGLEFIKYNYFGEYDVVISRGGTAKLLRDNLTLPVIEVEISMYDILCTMKLANGLSEKTAMVSFANITSGAKQLRDLLNYNMDIYTIESSTDVVTTLQTIRHLGYKSILCDMISNSAAKRAGIDSFLVASGPDSIRKAFDQAILLYSNQSSIHTRTRFFQNLLRGQLSQTVVLDNHGNVIFSTRVEQNHTLLEVLQKELSASDQEHDRQIKRSIKGILYSIRIKSGSVGEIFYTAFFIETRKTPLVLNQIGIKYSTRAEEENSYFNSLLSVSDAISDACETIEQINRGNRPVMIIGEIGTGKDTIASTLFVHSNLRNNAYITINCHLLTERSWVYLLESTASPLLDTNNTVYFSNIEALSERQRQQLLAALIEMDTCQRNQVFFSCVCQRGEIIPEICSIFLDKLCCISLYRMPLCQKNDRIPTLVNHYLSHLRGDNSKQTIGVDSEAMDLLQKFSWPHNYSQFHRVIKELVAITQDQAISSDAVENVLKKERYIGGFSSRHEDVPIPLDLNRPLSEINQDIAQRVVEEANGNQTIAAKRLGISRTTLWRLLQKSYTSSTPATSKRDINIKE